MQFCVCKFLLLSLSARLTLYYTLETSTPPPLGRASPLDSDRQPQSALCGWRHEVLPGLGGQDVWGVAWWEQREPVIFPEPIIFLTHWAAACICVCGWELVREWVIEWLSERENKLKHVFMAVSTTVLKCLQVNCEPDCHTIEQVGNICLLQILSRIEPSYLAMSHFSCLETRIFFVSCCTDVTTQWGDTRI